ncbi:hypothetical protein D3C86_1027870 [compost metagenome]
MPFRSVFLGEALGQLILVRRVDQDEPGDVVRVAMGEEACIEATEGVPDQDVRSGNAALAQQRMEFFDGAIAGSWTGPRFAPGVSGTVIRHHPREGGEFRLNRAPFDRTAANPCVDDDRRARVACGLDVKPVGAHVDQLAGHGMLGAIAMGADGLIASPQQGQCRDGGRDGPQLHGRDAPFVSRPRQKRRKVFKSANCPSTSRTSGPRKKRDC